VRLRQTTIPADDVFHAILELQLALLQRHFLNLLGLGEILFVGQFVQSVFQFAVPGGKLTKLAVGLDQQCSQIG
jgi:hypothetical protein